MQQRRKYLFFTGFYFIAYLVTKYTEPNSLFLNYTTTCLVGYFVGWLIVRRKKTGKNLTK